MIIRVIEFLNDAINAVSYIVVYGSGRTLEITHEMNLPAMAKRFMSDNPSFVNEHGDRIFYRKRV